MKRFMMKYLMLNCKEATFLMGMKEEGKLPLMGRLKLTMHTSMCSFCKRFEQQNSIIKQESAQLHSHETMPQGIEAKLEKIIREFE
jgi:hypothetical protein